MRIGVPKEIVKGEQRVGLVPETVGKLVDQGFEVLVQSGAGRDYNLDEAYEEAEARIVPNAREIYEESDVVLKVQKPTRDEVRAMHEGLALICFLQGPAFPELAWWLAKAGVTVFSVEAIPRISRAQSMDALSSMGSISGYKSAIIAANYLGKYFPMMTTAAGTTKASKVMVLGAGVAGLQAIATTKRLGAEVTAFDIRPEVKEQIESLGATFLDSDDEKKEQKPQEREEQEEYEPAGLAKLMVALGFNSFAEPPKRETAAQNGSHSQEEEEKADTGGYAQEQSEEKQQRDRELLRARLKEMDVVITTALVPGKKAPILVTTEMVEDMQPGSVIVDLAAENGGNCELTDPGAIVDHQQVKIIGPVNLPSSVPIHASQLYSRNMLSLINHLAPEGELELNFEDEITDGACIAYGGEIRQEATNQALADLQNQEEEAR